MKLFYFLLLVLLFRATALNAQTFTVNSITDNTDNNINDGVCNTGNMVGVSPECTLRAAIQETNASATPSTIHFNISTGCVNDICTITVDRINNGNLPNIVKQVTIDGSTQPGNSTVCTNSIDARNNYKIVVLGDGIDIGIRLESGSDNSIIRGLNVSNFLNNVVIVRSSFNVVECNFIGTDPTGMSSAGNNTGNGVLLICESTHNIIGGVNPEDGNLISAQGSDGIQFFSGFCAPGGIKPFENSVLGNYIGTNKLATAELNNAFSGISFFGTGGVHNNYIGLLQDGLTINGNIIGGNESGIYIDDGSSNITIFGNHIGTDTTGNVNLGNVFGGVDIISGNAIAVGGILPNQANNIAFNSEGVLVSGGATSINNGIRGNSFFDNTTQSIDIILDGGLEPDGLNINDADDADSGANKFINHPDIISVNLLDTTNPATVDVEFMVDATIANAIFPLTIDAYFSLSSDNNQGRFYLGSTVYPTAQIIVTENFTLPIDITIGRLVMSTTDDENNTSEFFFIDVGDVELIFNDGFE